MVHRDPFVLEQHRGEQRCAADDPDSGPPEATEHLETGPADEDDALEIEHDSEAGSTQFQALALEQIRPGTDDASVEN
jgi:hypothetical protein